MIDLHLTSRSLPSIFSSIDLSSNHAIEIFPIFFAAHFQSSRGSYVCAEPGCDFSCDSHMGLGSHRRAHLKASRKEGSAENGRGVGEGETKATNIEEKKAELTEVKAEDDGGRGD